jgi:hypothetical protein
MNNIDYSSANLVDNITPFQGNSDRELIQTTLQILPGQSNYSILVDSNMFQTPTHDIIMQNNTPQPKKQRFDSVTTFYVGALTVVGLLIVYRITYKKL